MRPKKHDPIGRARNATGFAPDMVKPAPASVAAFIVTGAVPVDDRLRVLVAGVLTATLPKFKLVALTLSVAVVAFN